MIDPMPDVRVHDPSLATVLDAYRTLGYEARARVDADGCVCCESCGLCVPPDDLRLDGLCRVEGGRDRIDLIVLALRCPACRDAHAVVARAAPTGGAGEALLFDRFAAQSSTLPAVIDLDAVAIDLRGDGVTLT